MKTKRKTIKQTSPRPARESDIAAGNGVSQRSKPAIDWNRFLTMAVQPIDNASLILFRVCFGAIMAGWAWDYLTNGRVTALYVNPQFNFSYYGLAWITPWGGNGMYFHFLAMVVLALMIAAGFLYRAAACGFAVLFTYFFLLERTNYQNHYYLICLISWWMVVLPLNCNVSVDAWLRPKLLSQTLPRWCLWVLLFHIAVPYFYGGIAKLNADWMLGQPMGIMLSRQADFPVLGPWLAWGPAKYLFSWFGILFDLLVVPALIWKKTRVFAYLLSVAFHLSNSVLFSIHIFPWFMIVGTTLFFEPDWPRRVLTNGFSNAVTAAKAVTGNPELTTWYWTPKRRLIVASMLIYVVFHAIWPLRHNLYPGDASWNERGHLFAWRMMLRGKETGIGFALRDPLNGQVTNVDHAQFLAAEQAQKFPRDPEMILHMAHFLAEQFEKSAGRRPEVYALALTSLNGRKPQFIVDPNTDLAAEPRGIFWHRTWVPPLSEPFRSIPWDIPVSEWSQHVEMPDMKFLQGTGASSSSSPPQPAEPLDTSQPAVDDGQKTFD